MRDVTQQVLRNKCKMESLEHQQSDQPPKYYSNIRKIRNETNVAFKISRETGTPEAYTVYTRALLKQEAQQRKH